MRWFRFTRGNRRSMDFRAITAVNFRFAHEGADQARRIGSYTLGRSRRRMAMLSRAAPSPPSALPRRKLQ
jgi:hypothetical protein